MARNVLRPVIVVFMAGVLTLLSACGGVLPMMDVLRGNLEYGRGDYQSALVHYMVALESDPEDSWTRFNIGSVYYALGEHEAALEIWQEARATVENEAGGNAELLLVFATSYNRGVLLYQQGRYLAAYDEFRYALSVNSRSAAAKANLELALEKIEATDSAASDVPGAEQAGSALSAEPPGAAGENPDEQTLRILEYVRRKETQRWFANQDVDSQDQSEDW